MASLSNNKRIRRSTALEDYDKSPTFVRQPNEHDIISVRGFGKSLPGIMKFRELVRKNHRAYQKSESSRFRADLAKKIRDQLLPGRFLKKDCANQEGYRIMDEDETLTKIMFSMRDCKSSKPIHGTWKATDDDDDDDNQDQDDPNTSKELDDEEEEMEEEDEKSQGFGKQETNIENEEDYAEIEENEGGEEVYEDEPDHEFQYSKLGTNMM